MALLNTLKKRFRFSKAQRLNQSSDYQALFDTPDDRFSNRAFLMLVKNRPSAVGRLGLVISKKKAKRAVDRNLVKRLCRDGFRLRQQQLVGLDVLILLRAFPAQADNLWLRSQLDELWAKLLAKPRQD